MSKWFKSLLNLSCEKSALKFWASAKLETARSLSLIAGVREPTSSLFSNRLSNSDLLILDFKELISFDRILNLFCNSTRGRSPF